MILYKQQQDFLDKSLDILELCGSNVTEIIFGKELPCQLYEDPLIRILKSDDDQHMIMLRKQSNSLFFMFNDGITIRFHHEYVFLEDHINKILEGIRNVRR